MSKKQRVVYAILFFLVMTGIFMISQQKNSYRLKELNQAETLQITVALLDYRNVPSDEGGTLYQNLLQQTSVIARQFNALLFEDEQNYIDTTIELTDIREQARQLDGFSDITSLQLSKEQVQRDETYYKALKESGKTLPLESLTFGRLIISLLTILGVAWFPLISVVNARLIVDEKEHESLLKGQPRSLTQRLVRNFIKKSLILGGVLVLTIGYLAILQSISGSGFGDLSLIEVVYQNKFVITTVVKKVCYYILFGYLVFMLSFLISSVLNNITKNSYVTVIIECMTYAFIWLFPTQLKLATVLSPSLIIEGTSYVSINQGVMYLLGSIVVLIVIFFIQLKLSRGGRRND
ncbi:MULTISPECIES: hypothetical protein [Vagococcus]|uniref:hypothetical protein n=1 Tax=Vagococcus TaxID=2737 RepID=UPI000E46CDF3|nr:MULTISPECIES: hypothetical protein [Vagococcus]RHH67255.1 hypothetical protein DW196_09645 [Vagococcus sp. AM17-17]